MSIRRKFYFSISSGFFAILLILILFVSWNISDIMITSIEEKISQIKKNHFQLVLLTNDYFINPNNRIKEQWVYKNKQLQNLLKESKNISILTQKGKNYINNSLTRLNSITNIFQSVFQQKIFKKRNDSKISKNISQILIRMSLFNDEILLLDKHVHKRISFLKKNIYSMFFVILILLFFSILIIIFIFKDIFKSIILLNESMKVIKEGNLWERLSVNRNDEIGNMMTLFNSMIEKIQNANHILEERTIELEKSNKELEQFAYVASHDLQEPLRMVSSYLQLVDKRYTDKIDQDGKEFIQYAVEGAKRMQDLIMGLLEFSRIGRKLNPIEKVDTNKIITEVLDNLHYVIKENKVKIDKEDLPKIYADRIQIMMIFQNLIQNGIKFSNNNPHIVIGHKEDDTDHIFYVQDNGIGIENHFFEQIFVIFKRLHPRNEYPGTGIGLSICKRIVERHKGNIWIESEPNKGSIFYFSIPKEFIDE